MREESGPDNNIYDIRSCIKNLEKVERLDRANGKIHRAAMLRKAIAQLKMAQRSS